MAKKNQNQEQNININELNKAKKYYLLGNFYLARKLAREIFAKSEKNSENYRGAETILFMTSPDLQALGSGILVLIFALTAAYIAAY
jgi:hypothetical protein